MPDQLSPPARTLRYGESSGLPDWCGATGFGGNCPVQAEGELDGAFWYFRARGSHWSITVHVDPEQRYWCTDRSELYYHDEPYGEFPDAGWMPREEAAAFIVRELSKWRDSKAVGHE